MFQQLFSKIQVSLSYISCGCLDFFTNESSLAAIETFLSTANSKSAKVDDHDNSKENITDDGLENDKIRKTKCWSCHTVQQLDNPFFCNKCRCIQEIDENIDYFKLFGLNGFVVNHEYLATKARELQSQINPNNFRDKGIQLYYLSLQWNELLKTAYYTLCSSLKRGKYLLAQKKIIVPTNYYCLDENFLTYMNFVIKMMHLCDTKIELNDLKQKIRSHIAQQINKTGNSFESQDYETAEKDLLKLQYLYDVNKKINLQISNIAKIDIINSLD